MKKMHNFSWCLKLKNVKDNMILTCYEALKWCVRIGHTYWTPVGHVSVKCLI